MAVPPGKYRPAPTAGLSSLPDELITQVCASPAAAGRPSSRAGRARALPGRAR